MDARGYAEHLVQERVGIRTPLDRLEPDTVMVDFIRHITRGMNRVESDLSLGKTQSDGDNSDNGHFVIDLGILKKGG